VTLTAQFKKKLSGTGSCQDRPTHMQYTVSCFIDLQLLLLLL